MEQAKNKICENTLQLISEHLENLKALVDSSEGMHQDEIDARLKLFAEFKFRAE